MKLFKGILVVLIPLLFLVTLVVLLLKISGFDIKEEGGKLTSLLSFHSQKVDNGSAGANQSDLSRQIETLKKQVNDKDHQIQDLKKEISDLENNNLKEGQGTNASNTGQSNSESNSDPSQSKTISQVYGNMDPAKAAAIFLKMKDQEAANYLNMLNNRTKAKIMEELPPDKAAKLTALLSPSSSR
ncbi:MotE family protein [Camelliibacillus cellulosilyticus]|uniref:MotE family protein n=1 Tax=Camelliibacillus cellulosilyticus TaxID=2174486 RepID=A0ABV9GKZ3_9BACL